MACAKDGFLFEAASKKEKGSFYKYVNSYVIKKRSPKKNLEDQW